MMAENREQNIENKVQDHVEENCEQIEMKEDSLHKAASVPRRGSYAGFSSNEISIHEVSKMKRIQSYEERKSARVCKCYGNCYICTMYWANP